MTHDVHRLLQPESHRATMSNIVSGAASFDSKPFPAEFAAWGCFPEKDEAGRLSALLGVLAVSEPPGFRVLLGRETRLLAAEEVGLIVHLAGSRTRLRGEPSYRMRVGFVDAALGVVRVDSAGDGSSRLRLAMPASASTRSEVLRLAIEELIAQRVVEAATWSLGEDAVCSAARAARTASNSPLVTVTHERAVSWATGPRPQIVAWLRSEATEAASHTSPPIAPQRAPQVAAKLETPSYLRPAAAPVPLTPAGPPAPKGCCGSSPDETVVPAPGTGIRPALPFAGRLSAEAEVALVRPISADRLRNPDETLPIAPPGAQAKTGTFVDILGAPNLPLLSLDEYAEFCAWRSVVGGEPPDLLVRFKLESSAAAAAVRERFGAYFQAQPSQLPAFVRKVQERAAALAAERSVKR